MKPDIGDTVRIVHSRESDLKSLSGRLGCVYGETTPSSSKVDVIGECSGDYAVNVHFDDLDRSYWFASDLLEFVDHGEGTEISLDGVDKKWVRNSSGEWDEISTNRPWWKFWHKD